MLPLLIDFDGVLRLGDTPAPDLIPFFDFLARRRVPYCVLSNSTLRTGTAIEAFIKEKGGRHAGNAMTTIDAAVQYIRENQINPRVYVHPSVYPHFEPLIKSGKPDAIVIGDIGNEFSYSLLNEIFQLLMGGVSLIALHKNRWWKPDGENARLDAGAFIHGLEYASGAEAFIIGKPSQWYFEAGLRKTGHETGRGFIMMGDDMESDIIPARKYGGISIILGTGKETFPLPTEKRSLADYSAGSLTECTEIIQSLIDSE